MRRRVVAESEERDRVAHLGAWFARQDRLKPLKHYQRSSGSAKQSPAEMLATLRGAQARGAAMTFTKRDTNP